MRKKGGLSDKVQEQSRWLITNGTDSLNSWMTYMRASSSSYNSSLQSPIAQVTLLTSKLIHYYEDSLLSPNNSMPPSLNWVEHKVLNEQHPCQHFLYPLLYANTYEQFRFCELVNNQERRHRTWKVCSNRRFLFYTLRNIVKTIFFENTVVFYK